MQAFKEQSIWAVLRLVIGLILFWSFADKLLGLSFSTAPDKSWLAGNSPTLSFLKFGTHGPFAGIFQSLAGNVWIDIFFMAGLALAGLSLILGIGIRIAAFSGVLIMFLIWLSLFPPKQNPILDEHVIYIIILLVLPKVKAGQRLGLGKWWVKTNVVKKYPFLE